MGDPSENKLDDNNKGAYSDQAAAQAFTVARMAQTFDRTLSKTKDYEAAEQAVENTTSDINLPNYNYITVASTTAIVAYDPLNHKATIALDPTHSFGDRWDAFHRGPEDHSLSGKVHGGVYKDMVSQQNHINFPGDNMREVIEGILHDYASKNEGSPLTVDFSGFSMGGAKSAIMAGELIGQGFFDNNDNMSLGNIHAFGPPAYGDQEFTDALNQKVEELGGHMWMVQLHGDNMPDVLSPEGKGLAKYKYEQAGEHVYLVPAQDGTASQRLFNPTDEQIEALPDADKDVKAHSPEAYKNTLDQLSISETNAPASIEAAPEITLKL